MITINLTPKNLIALCALFAALICLLFSYEFWQWRNDWTLAHQENAKTQVIAPDQTVQLIASLPEEHLFGKPASDVPITNLQFRVTGIVKVDDEMNSSKAYISVSGQPSKIYQAGDSLPYGVKVYEITQDAVMLENDGKLEKLPLPREKLEFKPRDTEEPV